MVEVGAVYWKDVAAFLHVISVEHLVNLFDARDLAINILPYRVNEVPWFVLNDLNVLLVFALIPVKVLLVVFVCLDKPVILLLVDLGAVQYFPVFQNDICAFR